MISKSKRFKILENQRIIEQLKTDKEKYKLIEDELPNKTEKNRLHKLPEDDGR